MRTRPLTRRFIATVLGIVLTAMIICIWFAKRSVHPQFGRVYHCSYDMLGSTRRAAEWVDHHSPVRTRFIKYVQAHPTRRLALGTNTLVVGPQNPITRTTLLALYVPPSTNGFWEFAPCGRTNLMEVTAEDLRITFVGLGDPSGSASFGNDWASTAVRVREGEILFARRVGRAGPVYVIWFTRVSADEYAINMPWCRSTKRPTP